MSRPNFGETSPVGPGYTKLFNFCEKARDDYGCAYVWSDTCCINKESSAELDEAIRSMFRWYRGSRVCIAHLANSSSVGDFKHEPWFKRGWTLQELLAPKTMRFYGKDWRPLCPAAEEGYDRHGHPDGEHNQSPHSSPSPQLLNDKCSDFMLRAVSKATDIPEPDIKGYHADCNRVAEKMKWAANRRTTRVEDTAYSLLGLFNVSIPIAYGEGQRSFYRLMEAIVQKCEGPGFFAW
ncbi:hypothetical protein BU15DRAFT_55433, partial [Melanogaster broomeanus]